MTKFFTTNLQWDLCAGAAILNSLGGRMTDVDGKEIEFDHEWDIK